MAFSLSPSSSASRANANAQHSEQSHVSAGVEMGVSTVSQSDPPLAPPLSSKHVTSETN